MVGHSTRKVAAYVRALKRADAPQTLINAFKEIVEIDSGIADEGRGLESLDRLLLDVCRRYGFAKVFDKPNARAWLRPSTIGNDCADSHADTGWSAADETFNPIVEQAYRRGYDQGFDAAINLSGVRPATLLSRQTAIRKWRLAPIYFGGSTPGAVETWGVSVSIRSSLPARLRFDIFERDGKKCVVCGRSASDGIVLHVDHIVAVANGGTNEASNLQTLCEECNLGKGAR